MRLLVGAGADLNVKDKDLFTPLHVAAVSALMEGGASLTETNLSDNTLVHQATLNRHVDILQEMIKRATPCDNHQGISANI